MAVTLTQLGQAALDAEKQRLLVSDLERAAHKNLRGHPHQEDRERIALDTVFQNLAATYIKENA